jgi:hypothetical protein
MRDTCLQSAVVERGVVGIPRRSKFGHVREL